MFAFHFKVLFTHDLLFWFDLNITKNLCSHFSLHFDMQSNQLPNFFFFFCCSLCKKKGHPHANHAVFSILTLFCINVDTKICNGHRSYSVVFRFCTKPMCIRDEQYLLPAENELWTMTIFSQDLFYLKERIKAAKNFRNSSSETKSQFSYFLVLAHTHTFMH